MNCAPTSAIPRICSRFSASCSPNTTWTNPESSSPPTPSGRCRATPPIDTNPEQPPFYVLVGDPADRGNRPSVWPAQWSASTANSCPHTSRRKSDPDELRQDHGAAAAHGHPDPRPAADPELDDLRHPRRVRADPAGTVEPDSVRQPADPADRRRRQCSTWNRSTPSESRQARTARRSPSCPEYW